MTHLGSPRYSLRHLLTCAGLLVGSACGDAATGDQVFQPGDKLSVFTFWVNPGESDAYSELTSAFEKRYPGVEVVGAPQTGGGLSAREQLLKRFRDRNLPDVFQANAGFDLLDWVLYNQRDATESKLDDVSDLYSKSLKKHYPPQVLQSVRHGERYYGVPVNVHRDNMLLYDVDFFEAQDFSPPTYWDELLSLCDRIQTDHGFPAIALGIRGRWPLHVLIESVMLSAAGPDFYRAFWGGRGDPDAPEIDLTLDRMLEFRRCMSPHAARRDWAEALTHVIRPKNDTSGALAAAMAPMGDWAKGYLQAEQAKASSQGNATATFDQVPFPGTSGIFVMTVDALAIPHGAPQPEQSRRFLEVLSDPGVLTAFSRKKGSIPPRSDIERAALDAMSRRSLDAFLAEDTEVVYAISMLLPARAVTALDNALFEMFEDGEKETVRMTLRNYYPLIELAARLMDFADQ